MRDRVSRSLTVPALVVVLIVTGVSAAPRAEKTPVTLTGGGSIVFSTGGVNSFVLRGVATHVGRYTCLGELQFVPGATPGSLNGVGVAEIIGDDGAQIVGVVTWQTNAHGGGHMAFSWRDFVEFSDGSIVQSTRRFTRNRPPGAEAQIELMHETTHAPSQPERPIHVGIIAILIG